MPETHPQAEALIAEALPLHRAGQVGRAQQMYQQALALAPGHAEAHHLLGVTWLQLGDPAQALAALDAALAAQPGHARALNNAGAALRALGRLAEAEARFAAAAAAQPDFVDALHNQAGTLLQLGRAEAAVAVARRLLALAPQDPGAQAQLGLSLAAAGQQAEALAPLAAALAAQPGSPLLLLAQAEALEALDRPAEALAALDALLVAEPGHANAAQRRAVLLAATGRAAEALAGFLRLEAQQPRNATLRADHADALSALRRPAEAVAAYDAALALDPNLARAWDGRGAALLALGQPAEALESHERALLLAPDAPLPQLNRAHALRRLGRLAEAATGYQAVLSLQPGLPDALAGQAGVLEAQGQLPAAMAALEAALAADPGFIEARFDLSLMQLRAGDLAQGFTNFEARRGCVGADPKLQRRAPLWLGETPLAGRTILLHDEQGFGDTLQFCRYAPLLAEQAHGAARVVLEVPVALAGLLRSLPGNVQVVPAGQPLPPHDLQCSLMSLPLALRTRLESIPAAVPYLAADPARVAAWDTSLPARAGLRIALVASGSTGHLNDANRSIPLARLALALAAPGRQLLLAQTELRPNDAGFLAQSGQAVSWLGQRLTDFNETAALLANCDLVVSVDTSVAHLAGALGRPTWLLLPAVPDWRWLLGRADTPWYPTMRLFRQPRLGDWDSVLGQISAELEQQPLQVGTLG